MGPNYSKPQICLLFGLTCCPACIGTMPSLLPELTTCTRKLIAKLSNSWNRREGLVIRHPNISFAHKDLLKYDGMRLKQLGNSVFAGWHWNFIIEPRRHENITWWPSYLKFRTAFALSLNKLLFASFKVGWVKLVLA